jgi:hypothetical protein
MMRWLLVVVLGGVLIACLLIAGTRLSPAPDAAPFQQLWGDECPVLCQLGIELETMAFMDAVAVLRDHAWVQYVQTGSLNPFQADVSVAWQWSGQQPDYIDARVPGVLTGRSFRGDSQHVVLGVWLATHWRLGEIEQALGPTANGQAFYDPERDAVAYLMTYQDPASLLRMNLSATIPCPAAPMAFWQARAQVHYQHGQLTAPYMPPTALRAVCRG